MPRKRYLVAYDIREDRRLRAVHKTMKCYGDPLQYSVFLCDLDPSERVHMKADLRMVMNERVDSVAIVELGDPRGRGLECFEFLGPTMDLPETGPRVV